ncbi:MAG: hypothetical protein JW798_10660 [Prolixibacteraceae bacterium]|nr:hypothetical protein [Prolixibacteraceae bacterium]
MKTLIVYDSVFGNTAKIAMAICQGCTMYSEVSALGINEFTFSKLSDVKLLIVGSPTRGFRPTPAIGNFLKHLPEQKLNGVLVAAFDTRLSLKHCNSGFIRFIVKNGGYAANNISSKLVAKGGENFMPPEGFLVTGEEGPLLESEIKRAQKWAETISEKAGERLSEYQTSNTDHYETN